MTQSTTLQQEPQVYHNFIAGQWVPSLSGRTYQTVNPANKSEIVGYFQESSRADGQRAIRASHDAFPEWASTPAPTRGLILFKAWELLHERAEDFARTMTLEEGKPLVDAHGEVKRSLNVLEFVAGEGRRLKGETLPSELRNNFAYTIKKPLGVVAIITPWNFPLAIAMWKIAPALVSGNTAVFKPASGTPLTAVKIVQLFADAGLPPGVLNMVTGPGATVGFELVEDPLVRAVSFTGSTDTGTVIYEKAAKTLKRVQCEMGGKNAVVVLEDADLELAVEGIAQGAFGSTGQRCTATSRVIVLEAVKEQFLNLLVARTRRVRVGSGFTPGVEVAPLASESQFRKVSGYIEEGRREGARLVHGGGVPAGDDYQRGFYLEPTIFAEVQPSMRIFQEEIFGPVVSIATAKTFEEAVRFANDVKYGLSASIYTRDLDRAFRFVDQAEVGMVHINSPTLGGEAHVPFGGIKASGLGEREQGSTAVDFFTEDIVVYIDYTGRKRDAKFI